jgi:pimeloyl-ACP methyl ester carboxylesterase
MPRIPLAILIATALIGATLPAAGRAAESVELPHRSAAVEAYPNVDVRYDAVRDPAGRQLRLILSRPHSAAGRLPTIFVAGWLSCDTVEAPADTKDASGQVFRVLAQLPEIALVRMDKPGVGDSEGDCAETDFDSELAAYRAAFRQLATYDFVDPDHLFVFGVSNGGGWAPLLAQDRPVRGYIVDGGWLKTWFEHMVEIERRRLTLAGKMPGEVNRLMSTEAAFYARYLLDGQSPQSILREHPDWAAAWPEKDGLHQYGRPVAYYQQLQKLNLAEAWSKVSAPVLVLSGQYDWIMTHEDGEQIAALVNHAHPGTARFVELPRTGHTFEHYSSLDAAFKFAEEPFDPAPAQLIAAWLQEHLS